MRDPVNLRRALPLAFPFLVIAFFVGVAAPWPQQFYLGLVVAAMYVLAVLAS